MATQYEVHTNPQDGSAARLLFAGTEDDARDFVENHFPRVHSEPGRLYGEDGPQADAVLVHPVQGQSKTRKREVFDGAEWGEPKGGK